MSEKAHVCKEQTKEHQAAMKSLCESIINEGFTPDEIIDAGDYLLNQMTVEELRGDAKDEKSGTKKTSKGSAKSEKSGKDKGSKESVQQTEPESDKPAKSGKSGKSGKKGKDKKGKDKKSKKSK